jgi:hypothetical protein
LHRTWAVRDWSQSLPFSLSPLFFFLARFSPFASLALAIRCLEWLCVCVCGRKKLFLPRRPPRRPKTNGPDHRRGLRVASQPCLSRQSAPVRCVFIASPALITLLKGIIPIGPPSLPRRPEANPSTLSGDASVICPPRSAQSNKQGGTPKRLRPEHFPQKIPARQDRKILVSGLVGIIPDDACGSQSINPRPQGFARCLNSASAIPNSQTAARQPATASSATSPPGAGLCRRSLPSTASHQLHDLPETGWNLSEGVWAAPSTPLG